MTEQEFDDALEAGDLDNEYWEYVVDKGAGSIPLHEDAIFDAIESGDYYDGFKEAMIGEK